jgi:hypothetical protein
MDYVGPTVTAMLDRVKGFQKGLQQAEIEGALSFLPCNCNNDGAVEEGNRKHTTCTCAQSLFPLVK